MEFGPPMDLKQIKEPGRMRDWRDHASGMEFSVTGRNFEPGNIGFVFMLEGHSICYQEMPMVRSQMRDGIAVKTFEIDYAQLERILNFPPLRAKKLELLRKHFNGAELINLFPRILAGWEAVWPLEYGADQSLVLTVKNFPDKNDAELE